MSCKVLQFDGVRWLTTGRKGTRAHAFERDSFVSLCGAVTLASPDQWGAAVERTCARCRAALKRGRLVRS